MSGFGTPKFNASTYAKTLRLKEGSVTVRILPPMHSLADEGIWAVYLGTHFGYKGINPNNPDKPLFRPFKCIEDRDYMTKMLRQSCPECDLITEKKEMRAKAMAQARVEAGQRGEDPEVAEKEAAEIYSAWLYDHNVDRKWHLNVMVEGGEFATLQISHRTKKLLDKKIAEVLTDDSLNALDLDQGVWFRFTRTGKGVDTQDSVDIVQESVRDATGRVIRSTKKAPLSQAEQQKALAICPDLKTVVKELSYAQIEQLTQSSGSPESVDAILGLPQKLGFTSQKAISAGNGQPTSAGKTPSPADSQLAQIAALQAQLAALQASASTAAPVLAKDDTEPEESSPVPPQAATTPAEGLSVDRSAFLKRFKTQPK